MRDEIDRIEASAAATAAAAAAAADARAEAAATAAAAALARAQADTDDWRRNEVSKATACAYVPNIQIIIICQMSNCQ